MNSINIKAERTLIFSGARNISVFVSTDRHHFDSRVQVKGVDYRVFWHGCSEKMGLIKASEPKVHSSANGRYFFTTPSTVVADYYGRAAARGGPHTVLGYLVKDKIKAPERKLITNCRIKSGSAYEQRWSEFDLPELIDNCCGIIALAQRF